MFTVTMLPAHEGDALWIEYGPSDAPHRILVDAGPASTWKGTLKSRLEAIGTGRFELLVITHVDSDHVGGVLPLIARKPTGIGFDAVWFNAWRHLDPDSRDMLGPPDGEILTVLLDSTRMPWNRAFRTHDHAVRTPSGRRLPTRVLPGGIRLTVIAPTSAELDILKPKWKEVVERAGLLPGRPSRTLADKAKRKGIALDLLGGDPISDWADYDPTELDPSETNGSSISMLAEFDDPDDGRTKRCLLTGDSHGPVLEKGIRRLAAQRGEARLAVDVMKAPHHGSLHNVTRALVRSVDAPTWLFSSNGVKHGHPHKEAVARVVHDGGRPLHLKFNYRTPVNEIWDNCTWKQRYGYATEFGNGSLTVRI